MSRWRCRRAIWWRWSGRTAPARPRCCGRWRGCCRPKARSMSAATRCPRCRCANVRKRFGYLPQGHVVHWPLPARDIVALGRYPHGATDPARLSPGDTEAVLRAMQATDVMRIQRAPRHRIVGRRAQPRRAGPRAGGGSAGDPGRRADRFARSAPPDRRHEKSARRRRQRRAGHRGDARSRPGRAICRHTCWCSVKAVWSRRARRWRRSPNK